MRTKTRTKRETALTTLEADHDKLKKLFERFEKAHASEKQEVMSEALKELEIHAAVEEQLFYPALRQQMEDEDGLMDEADEEHHVVKFLIAELEQMQGNENHWEAKFKNKPSRSGAFRKTKRRKRSSSAGLEEIAPQRKP